MQYADGFLRSSPFVEPHLREDLPEFRPYHLLIFGFDQQDCLPVPDWSPEGTRTIMQMIHDGFIKCVGNNGEVIAAPSFKECTVPACEVT